MRAVVVLTVRGLPLPPSLQVRVAPLTRPVAVIVDVPSQLSTLPKVGAAGVVFTVSVTVDVEKTDGSMLLATFAYTLPLAEV